MPAKCPKCARKFASERGLKIHTSRCTQTKSTTKSSTSPKYNWSQILIGALAILLLINLIVMGFFTATVNNKLTEAIELTKPQEVSLTLILPKDCPDCQSLEPLRAAIAKQDVELISDQTLYDDTSEAQALISKLTIQKLPALILQSKKPLKQQVKEVIQNGSRETSELELVWEQTAPPYLDLATGDTAGLVTVTYLTDESCSNCYDVMAIQKPILTNFGLAIADEKIIDRQTAAGRQLIQKYDITKVPTIILSAETSAYAQIDSIWQQVGTVEPDGSFVFRNPDILPAAYRDLTTNQVVQPPPQQPSQPQ